MMHALLFVSMGVEARCRSFKSTAHYWHMKGQPFLCKWSPLPWLSPLPSPLPSPSSLPTPLQLPLLLPLPSAIAFVVPVDHCRRHLCRIAVSHRCCCCPCHRPLLSPSPSAIAVAIAASHHRHHDVGHFWELLPWHGKNCIRPIEAKNAHLILFCSESGRCTDQSQMTDQVSSGDGQHHHWAASSEYWADSEGGGWQQGGSRGAEGWRRWLTMGGVILFGCWSISHWHMAFAMICWMW